MNNNREQNLASSGCGEPKSKKVQAGLLALAKSLGIDPGPLNQVELQEQTCSAAMTQITELAAQVERLQKIPYTKTRAEFMESWGVDGMPADKKRVVIAAWDRAEWFFNQQVDSLKTQWQAEYEHCNHKYARFGDQPHRRCIKCARIERAQEAGDE